LTDGSAEGSIPVEEMEEQQTVFISSCSRRELARRRPRRSPLRLQIVIVLAALAAVIAVLALRGAL
jgi:hypothetical protein